VRISDFNRLSIDEPHVLNFYDDQGNLVNRLATTKGREQFALVVEHNSRKLTYRMMTYKRERRKRIRRQAHPVVIKHWNSRHEALKNDVQGALDRLREGRGANWEQFETHLFTDQRMAPFVKANHDEVRDLLEKLALQLDKLRYSYEERA
jgi:hypothetical protein